MNQSIQQLLALLLAATSVCVMTPCQAKTPKKVNEELKLITSSSSSDIDTNLSSKLGDSSIPEQNKADIVAEVESNSAPSNNTISTPQATVRIPVSSRIFAVPSMQQ